MNFHIIIPARFASQRLPGKMLAIIAGKPLIEHVYERALLCGAASIIIATDDERIKKAMEAVGATVCMTSVDHPNGTDRLSEVVQKLKIADDAIIVNIQGDEPLIPPEAVRLAAKALSENSGAQVATLCTPIRDQNEIFDPNINKVILDKNGFALYFSRAPIPWDRKAFKPAFQEGGSVVSKEMLKTVANSYFRHIGLYAYRAKTLKEYSIWGQSALENIESLEQLRILWNGGKIHVSVVSETLPPGIDTEMDLQRFQSMFEAKTFG